MAEETPEEFENKEEFQENRLDELDNELLYVEHVARRTEDVQNAVNELDAVNYTPAINKAKESRNQLNELNIATNKTEEFDGLLAVTKANGDAVDDVIEAEEDYNNFLNELNDIRENAPRIKKRPSAEDIFEAELTRSPEDYVNALSKLSDALGKQFENQFGESVDDALATDRFFNEVDVAPEEPIVEDAGIEIEPTPVETNENITNEVNVNVDQPAVEVTNVVEETEIVDQPAVEPQVVTVETEPVVITNPVDETEVVENTNNTFNENTEVVENVEVERNVVQPTVTPAIPEDEIQVEKEEAPAILDIQTPNEVSLETIQQMNTLLANLPNMISESITASLSELSGIMEGTKKEIIRNTENNSVTLVDNKPSEVTAEVVESNDTMQLQKMILMMDRRLQMIHTALQTPLEVRIKYD